MNKATTLNFGREKINSEADFKYNTVEETEETEEENALSNRFHSAKFEILDLSLYCTDIGTDMVQLVTYHKAEPTIFFLDFDLNILHGRSFGQN